MPNFGFIEDVTIKKIRNVASVFVGYSVANEKLVMLSLFPQNTMEFGLTFLRTFNFFRLITLFFLFRSYLNYNSIMH